LFNDAVFQRDFAVQRSLQGKAHAALDLRADDVRVDGNAAINGAHYAVDLEAVAEAGICGRRMVREDVKKQIACISMISREER